MNLPLLDISELKISLKTEKKTYQPVKGISFAIYPGKTLAIVGESGSGKTLTALSLIGLLPKNAQAFGKITLNDKDIIPSTKEQWREIRKSNIRMIFQDPMSSLNPTMPIGNQLMESFDQALEKKIRWVRAVDLLDKVGITDPEQKMRAYPHQLSGGQQQRVMIAIALSADPQLLIADEPTTALDVTIQAQIIQLLEQLQKKHQMSILLITHDLSVASHLADQIAVMYAGQIVEIADTKSLFENPSHPYTQALLKSIPSFYQKQRELTVIEGSPPNLFTKLKGCPFAPRCPYAMEKCLSNSPSLQIVGKQHQSACWKHS